MPNGDPATRGRARAVAREVGIGWSAAALRVDTYQAAPADMARYTTMNPFHWDPAWMIPVPGQPGVTSCSMEAVWQGLKIHAGETDFGMFAVRPYKRPADGLRGADFDYAGSRFLFRDIAVDLLTARLLIYLPAYLYLMDRLVADSVIEEIRAALATGTDVVFYDWDDNFAISDPGSSFSHSALLAAWFNGDVEDQFDRARRRLLAAHPVWAGEDLPLDRYGSVHERQVNK